MAESQAELEERLEELYIIPPEDAREIALLEYKLWEIIKEQYKARNELAPKRHRWFNDKFSYGADTEGRLTILSYESWAGVIWERINSKRMPLRTGVELIRKAKTMAGRDGLTREEAFKKLLAEYENLGPGKHLATNREGITYVRRSPTRKEVLPDLNDEEEEDIDVSDARKFLTGISALSKRFVDAKLEALDEPAIKEELANVFTLEVRESYEELLRKINRLQRNRNEVSYNRAVLVRACEFLEIPTPKPNQAPDMNLARARFRKLAANYHPDNNIGSTDPGLTEQFKAVNSAWRVVSEYSESLKKKKEKS